MSLPTKGRVLVTTSVGDIEIELWAKETPKACRNFITLALEGYYDGVIFHRVISDFLVQTGDRTGTGGGGESFYGEPFEDEIHPRLRFAHRGLVGMANNGSKDSNDSQFFITLDRADELHGKHTLFGRCVGDTFFNVLKIGQLELDGERPVYPPKIRTVKILDNPFDDIIPRITAAEKRAQQLAKEQGIKEREEAARKKNIKKNTKLLSFGQDADKEEGEEVIFKKKNITRPDLLPPPIQPAIVPDSLAQAGPSSSKPKEAPKAIPKVKPKGGAALPKLTILQQEKNKKQEMDISKIRETHTKEQMSESERRRAEIEKMEASIRKLNRKRGVSESGSDDEEQRAAKKAKGKGASYLEAEMAKYATRKVERDKDGKKKRRDESDILATLNSFRGKLKTTAPEPGAEDEGEGEENPEGIEIDDDRTWWGHELHFPKDDGAETQRAERDYEVIDPRNRSARAKEEEAERKRAQRKGRPQGARR